MLSNADSSWQMTQSATLPRSMRSSLYLRRRIEGLGPKIREGDSVRMSMPAEMCDFLDLAHGIDGGSGLVAEAAPDMGSHSSMLHALLSCLPEPPLTQPRCSVIETLSALADELPQPPLSPTNSLPPPPLSPPTSPMPTKARSLAALPSTAAVAEGAVTELTVDKQPVDTAADIELPPAVAGLDALAALETPASSRRNTDEVPLTQQQELRRLSDSPGLLDDDEMPPESPLFAGVADQDIRRMRDSIRNAKLARSRSVGAARSTWCAPGHEPLFASLHATNKTPARASLAAVLDGWAEDKSSTGEWLSSQQPPSDADESHTPATPDPAAAAAALPTDPPAPRWFRVRVHSLFSPEATHVSVAELSDAASTASSQTAVEDDDADMQAALAQHPAVLQSLKTPSRVQDHSMSRLRPPTRLSMQRLQPRLTLPSLEFAVSSSGLAASDRAVQSVDVDAMVAAYLPHIHAKLHGTIEGTRERTESESSARTLADTHSGSDYAESHDSASSEDTLLQQRTVRMRPAQSLPEQRRKTGCMDSKLGTPKPRHTVSIASLKAADGSAGHPRRQLHTLSQLAAAPATVASRRRSEVEALITQANAVLSRTPSGSLRRRSANQPHGASSAPSGLRPPRASFPLSSARMLPQPPQHTGSIVISPRNSIASPRGSVLSDSGLSRIPSPASALSSLQIARQPLHSDPIRRRAHLSSGSSNGEISPLALAPVQTAISSELTACRLPTSAPIRRSRPSISLSGLRPPQTSGLRMPSTPALKRPPAPASVPRGASSSLIAPSGGGGLAGARRLQGPASAQHLPRLLGSSGAMMRSSTVGFSGMSYAYSSDSEESSMLADSSDTLSQLRNPRAKGSGRSGPNRDDEFLTLRPVHTPDIVPRTIDPRLVERAMTPMLKLNVSSKQPAPSSSLSQMVQRLSDDNCSSMSSLPDAGSRVIVAAAASEDSNPEPRTSTNTDQVSRMSPLNSPKQSTSARASTDSGRRFGRPGFLARRWTKHSTVPVPAVSAIPMPPASTEKSIPKKSVSSKIPSLRKARSLWSLRPSLSK
ncbi:hypothetical protein IWW36_002665 [Coemansia brasiliensis]|uniref:Uncharacterized protein n=1 Tax=Coemansia brasiliensis TaxID=2650707 RepID=A0A9W8IFF8_9FUNG|nr:hypothetical protein IWW36_002665 [Coemansia brasiliensis]